MTLEQLKERIEATCNKNGIFPETILIKVLSNNDILCILNIMKEDYLTQCTYPSADLLIEGVDICCRAIKARQSSATNGID